MIITQFKSGNSFISHKNHLLTLSLHLALSCVHRSESWKYKNVKTHFFLYFLQPVLDPIPMEDITHVVVLVVQCQRNTFAIDFWHRYTAGGFPLSLSLSCCLHAHLCHHHHRHQRLPLHISKHKKYFTITSNFNIYSLSLPAKPIIFLF